MALTLKAARRPGSGHGLRDAFTPISSGFRNTSAAETVGQTPERGVPLDTTQGFSSISGITKSEVHGELPLNCRQHHSSNHAQTLLHFK